MPDNEVLISELSTKAVNPLTMFELENTTDGEPDSGKTDASALGNFFLGQGTSPLEYADLQTTAKTPIGAINEVKSIAEEYVEANPNESATEELLKLKVGSTVYAIGKKTIYGFHVDSSEQDPDACVIYLKDAVGYSPAYMDFVNDKFSWGSWRDAFFLPRPCMLNADGSVAYYLDENNYSKKEDGTASDVADATTSMNAMMEWGRNGQRIWYKIVPDSGDSTSYSVYIANYKADSDYRAWSFYDSENVLKEHFYTPIYNGSIDTNGKLRSLSGMTYDKLCQSKTASEEITAAELNNVGTDKGWYTEVFADVTLINFLLILMSKSLATQEKFGYGRINQASVASSIIGSGTMDNKGLFWGSDGNNDGVKVFGMENYWANQWRRYAGHWLINNVNYYKMTRNTADGSTASDYSTSDTNVTTTWLDGGSSPTADNYIRKMVADSNSIFVNDIVNGGYLIAYSDYFYQSGGSRYAIRGGICYNGRVCGAFYFALANAASNAGWSIGAAPSYR